MAVMDHSARVSFVYLDRILGLQESDTSYAKAIKKPQGAVGIIADKGAINGR